MKLTLWELEFMLEQVDKEIRRRVSQKRSTKTLEKLRAKLFHNLTLKDLPKK